MMSKKAVAVAFVALTINGQPISRAGDVDAVPILKQIDAETQIEYGPFPPLGYRLWVQAPGYPPGIMFLL